MLISLSLISSASFAHAQIDLLFPEGEDYKTKLKYDLVPN